MSLDINSAIGQMADAMGNSIGEGDADIASFATTALANQKDDLMELAQARLDGDLDDEEFKEELARAMQVAEVEMLSVAVIGKAAVQKAIQAAIGVLTKLVSPI